MTDRFPNRRWIFLTSGDIATKVNFNNVMEGSPETCRYNIAPPSESGTKSFVKYEKFNMIFRIRSYHLFTDNTASGDHLWFCLIA